MAVWVVKGGQYGEFEEFAISNNVVGIDFDLRQSVLEFTDRESLREHLYDHLTEEDDGKWVPNAASQLWRFATEIRPGDTVVLPCKRPRVVAIGKVRGEYNFEAESIIPHARSVAWEATDMPRTTFDQDLLYSFGGLLTVFQVNRANTLERIEQALSRYKGFDTGEAPVIPMYSVDDDSTGRDWKEIMSDRIVERIRQRFAGERVEYLVAEILKAEGYTALQTRRGSDGGVDVVAGKGDMGFGEPRLCVQVKSGNLPVDLPDYNRLQGNIRSSGAQHGLLVSLTGFTRTVLNENERSFFEIRLWGPEDLTGHLLDSYDNLPPDIRSDIPLVDQKVLQENQL